MPTMSNRIGNVGEFISGLSRSVPVLKPSRWGWKLHFSLNMILNIRQIYIFLWGRTSGLVKSSMKLATVNQPVEPLGQTPKYLKLFMVWCPTVFLHLVLLHTNVLACLWRFILIFLDIIAEYLTPWLGVF